MGKPTGFMEHDRQLPDRRPVIERVGDFKEIYRPFPEATLCAQAARCMDCGVPTCHAGCPLGNRIPDWNDDVYQGHWEAAFKQLMATNNFPEFTGRLCPAPCEEACVLAINAPAVTIEQIEKTIIEHAFEMGWVRPQPPLRRTGKTVAVVGSGPAGLACA
jgi:glutamate synthase (NADPH) small chain